MSISALTTQARDNSSRTIAFCALLVIAALYIVGIESHGVVRHFVQTAPVWPCVVFALRRSGWSKWTALPVFLFWFTVMALIWVSLLGIAHTFSGSFTRIEIFLTLVVGVCSVLGFCAALKIKAHKGAISACSVFCGTLVLQVLALRISFLPAIAHDHWHH